MLCKTHQQSPLKLRLPITHFNLVDIDLAILFLHLLVRDLHGVHGRHLFRNHPKLAEYPLGLGSEDLRCFSGSL
jgi:hypothetical protein